jgi:hypothetical protein
MIWSKQDMVTKISYAVQSRRWARVVTEENKDARYVLAKFSNEPDGQRR